MKIVNLLFMLNQLRIFHWYTKSFAQHEAFGKTYETLNNLIDEFIEVYIGKHGTKNNNITSTYSVQLFSYSEQSIKDFIVETRRYLTDELIQSDEYKEHENTDLLNIRDEMLAAINKLNYLLTLQ